MLDTNGIQVDYIPHTNHVVYIVAGNYHEAKRFAHSKQWHRLQWIYVYHVNQLRGLRGATVYLTGTYAILNTWLRILSHLTMKEYEYAVHLGIVDNDAVHLGAIDIGLLGIDNG